MKKLEKTKRISKSTLKTFVKSVAGVLVAGLGLAALGACHDWKNSSPAENAAHITDKVSGRLDLTEVQEKEFENLALTLLQLREQHLEANKPLADEVSQLIMQSSLSKDDILVAYETRIKSFESQLDEAASAIATFHATLSAEQKERIAGWIQKRRRGRH